MDNMTCSTGVGICKYIFLIDSAGFRHSALKGPTGQWPFYTWWYIWMYSCCPCSTEMSECRHSSRYFLHHIVFVWFTLFEFWGILCIGFVYTFIRLFFVISALNQMTAVEEQQRKFTKFSEKFGKRLAHHLNNLFIQQVMFTSVGRSLFRHEETAVTVTCGSESTLTFLERKICSRCR